jgi:hypothetical protein
MHRVFLDIGSQRTPSYAECAGEWDVRAIDVIFVEEKDDEINPLGVKGVGEIGIVGTGAAIAKRGLPCHRQARARSADHARQADAGLRL